MYLKIQLIHVGYLPWNKDSAFHVPRF